MYQFKLSPVLMPAYTENLRAEVRAFLDREMTEVTPVARAKSWAACDPEFSRRLGAQGWIGMTWPKEYGGQARPAIDRYVVMEELLAAGAPVGAHWIADRQSGPLIQNYGSEAAKTAFLQGITKGEIFFCIGMSEPNAGSDLAAIETSAERVDGGWVVNGAKLWTTNISDAHQMIALVRTDRSRETRHDGMSQLIIDLQAPGVTRRTIEDHQSERHFGEVYFDDVFVPDDMLIGEAGCGWKQVIEELALERSGPERYLSSYRLYEELVQAHKGRDDMVIESLVGELTAKLWNLRQMSLSVYESVGAKEKPDIEAAIVKDLGTTFEQALPLMVQAGIEQNDGQPARSDLIDVMEYLLLFSPIFSLRGGTREVLRGIIAREIGLR